MNLSIPKEILSDKDIEIKSFLDEGCENKAYLASMRGVDEPVVVLIPVYYKDGSNEKYAKNMWNFRQRISQRQKKGELSALIKIMGLKEYAVKKSSNINVVQILEYGGITLKKYMKKMMKSKRFTSEEKNKTINLIIDHINALFDSLESDGMTYEDPNLSNIVVKDGKMKFIDLSSVVPLTDFSDSAQEEIIGEIESYKT